MLAFVLLLATQDPAEPPPPLAPTAAPAPAPTEPRHVVDDDAPPVDDDVPAVDAASPAAPARPLSPLVQLCLQKARTDLAGGRSCLADLLEDDAVAGADRADAVAAGEVLQRLQRHFDGQPQPQPAPPPVSTVDRTAQFAVDGHLEAGVHGAAWGGLAGFLGTAGVLASTRTSERDAFPLLLTAPAVGVVAGAIAGIAAVDLLGATADDVALAASTTWAGTALGFTLQLAIFADESDVDAAPMRFFTTLAGGALGLAAGAGWGPFVDVSSGDASLANSGFFWGGVLTATTLGIVASTGTQLDFAQALMIVGGGSVLPWGLLLALHPLFDLHRVSTWLVDAGGVLGVIGGAAVAFIVAQAAQDGRVFLPVFGMGIAGGLAVGVGAAVVVDSATRQALDDLPQPLSFSPAFFPTHDGGLAPGVVVRVARW